MKIKSLNRCSIPRLGLNFEAGEVKDLIREQAETLARLPNFELVKDENSEGKTSDTSSDTGEKKDGYQHREMRRGRRNL